MSNLVGSVKNNNIIKPGLCPHGTIPGACPICSGMGGGGRIGERMQKPGEMSYHECAMIGAMMRAREAQQKLHEESVAHRIEMLKFFEQNMAKLADNFANFIKTNQNNFKFINISINIVVIPIINTLRIISNIIINVEQKFIQIKEKFIDIQDKLNAIFGELKVFIEKKVSEFVSVIKTKFKNLFKIFKRNNTENKEKNVEEDKKILKIKILIEKFFGKKYSNNTAWVNNDT